MSFDFSSYMHQVCDKAISQNEELAHIDLSKIVIAFAQARKRVPHGLFASLTPLRFANGAKEEVRRKRKVTIQRIVIREEEMLYILRFYLPRFWDLDFREKLITVFHELWHISPNCDGDIRRHAGRCFAHTHSQAQYDEKMGVLVDRWLAKDSNAELLAPLQMDFSRLHQKYGGVRGLRVPRPRIIPVE